MKEREKLASRLGFILLSAGCAIGLGNVWRFPYITGQYGGAAFVLVYLVFVIILGIPVMTMEFSVGRASQRSVATSFNGLEPNGSKWHWFRYPAMAGNYLLMMFYTTVAGWMLAYLWDMINGSLIGLAPEQIGAHFGALTGSPGASIGWMIAMCVIGFGVCIMGLQAGVEKITKIMMSCLFVIMIILAVRSVTLPGAGAGLAFYLTPNIDAFIASPMASINAAMGQAFFSLSLGMGSMQIFGSYLDRKRSLTGEVVNITILDTCAALLSGLIIFPAAFAFNIQADAGPPLVFITLPNIFNAMPMGWLWGSLFFLFMTFAALSTVIAVFENIIAFAMDLTGCSRKKAVAVNIVAIILLSIPCALGFNLWSGFNPIKPGWVVLDLEDFLVSYNILPLGALIYVLFCVSKFGWGWKNFIAEADAGEGIKFPQKAKLYVTYILPAIIAILFIFGYMTNFSSVFS